MLFDNFANDFLISNDVLLTTPPTIKSKTAEELLFELDQEIINEPSWFQDDKLNFMSCIDPLPIVVEIPLQLTEMSHEAEQEQKPVKIENNTVDLLNEFNTVYNAVGLQLTPPATPPLNQEAVTGSPIMYIVSDNCIQEITTTTTTDMIIDDALSESSESSMELIDELVRSHSFNLPDNFSLDGLDDDDDDDSVSCNGDDDEDRSISPCSNDTTSDPSYSPRSESSVDSLMSPRSESSFDTAGFEEEWTPTVDKIALKRKSSVVAGVPKREKRPYGRPPHEKKQRKKEQNKNAATRYRQKKKEQLAVVLTEEQQLVNVNVKLQTKYDDVKREINYLKKLMREILVAKGVQI